jgi:UDP-N-acetylmuramyl pentapeptide phosphotransferase/UDP-N-acetylglucosamine-1-phosphate transferase
LDPLSFVLPVIVGVVTALGIDLAMKRVRLPLDRPNERSLHATPTPRSGGLVATPVALAAWLLLVPDIPWSIWGACALLFVVSAMDDLHSLPVAIRFTCHLAAAALATTSLESPPPGPLAIGLIVLAIGWMTNLYNFMDGSDGLAGGMAVIGFGTYGCAAWLGADSALAVAAWVLASAAAGFLAFNFPPAKVFLGDAGSIPFGGMAGALGLLGWSRGLWPAWFPLLVFAPFIVDASVTLVRRGMRGEKVWQAHREHYYQRLVRLGWGHRRTALVEYALMAVCAGVALAGLRLEPLLHGWLLLVIAAAFLVLMLLIDRAWQRHALET